MPILLNDTAAPVRNRFYAGPMLVLVLIVITFLVGYLAGAVDATSQRQTQEVSR